MNEHTKEDLGKWCAALVAAFEDISNTQGRAEQYTATELHGAAFANAHAACAAFRGEL